MAPPPPPPQPPPPPSAVDPRVWRAFAGPSTRLLPIGSRVYYFPEGHAEHAWRPPSLSSDGGGGGAFFFSCGVVGTSFLANPRSDEVFSEIHLDPSPSAAPAAASSSPAEEDASAGTAWSGSDGGMAWFVKILTTSDANCGGAFSVPRYCAEHIFPPLDLTAHRPVQTLSISDLHGTVWKFRHVYRGSPLRHLLTTGWSKFADSKQVVSGDAIVFVKNKSNGDLFVGFRRALRLFDAHSPFMPFHAEIHPEEDERTISDQGFSRCVRGRIPSANVVEAARSAALGRPFKVLYYPMAGLPEFVVPEAGVDATIRFPWKPGMRAKFLVEDANSFTMHGVWGTVAEIAERWAQSPWRMLKVTWDKPEVMKNRGLNKVSPWQVVAVSSTPPLQIQYSKNSHLENSRVLENSGSLSDERKRRVLEKSGDERNNILNPKYKTGETVTSVVLQSPEHRAGMQGTRQDPICFLPTKRNEVAGSSGSEPSSTPAFSKPTDNEIVLFGQTIIKEPPSTTGGADRQ